MSAAVATPVAFIVSCAVALLGTPLARRLALQTGFFDRPGSHKRHSAPVPYLGGLAIIAATFVGVAVGRRPGGHVAAIMVGGAVMGVVGLLDDDGGLKPLTRLLAQVAATVPVVASGIRMEVSGVAAFDVVFTVVWIVTITNAVNFLDNMDGLAAGLGAVSAAAACAIAAMSGQVAIAAMAAAVVGACIGFLAFNRPPAAIYMGDTGALFLGFILATLSIEVRPATTPPVGFLVPALLLAVPLLDIVVVVLSRMRRAIPVATGGRNHLSHRLVACRLSPGAAVLVLVIVEAAAGGLALCLDRGILSPVATVITAAALLGSLVALTARASVFDRQPTVRLLRRMGKIIAVIAAVTVAASALPVWAIVTSQGHIDAGIRLTTASLGDLRDGDLGSATVDLARARARILRGRRAARRNVDIRRARRPRRELQSPSGSDNRQGWLWVGIGSGRARPRGGDPRRRDPRGHDPRGRGRGAGRSHRDGACGAPARTQHRRPQRSCQRRRRRERTLPSAPHPQSVGRLRPATPYGFVRRRRRRRPGGARTGDPRRGGDAALRGRQPYTIGSHGLPTVRRDGRTGGKRRRPVAVRGRERDDGATRCR